MEENNSLLVKVSKISNTMKGVVICLCVLIFIYIGFAIYFGNHFYFGTTINEINVSGKSVETADELISDEISSYSLQIEERNNIKEEIKASDVGLKYNKNEETEKIINNQTSYLWFIEIFKNNNYILSDISSYDNDKLKEHINTLACFDEGNLITPKNPTFEYINNSYSIVDEVYGNKIIKDILLDKISTAINNMNKTINLEEQGCYENPKYTKESPEVLAAKDELGKYSNVKITYKFGDIKEVLDGKSLKDLIDISDGYIVNLNEEKVKNYVDNLAKKYNTLGKTRDFTTSTGNKVKIDGGDYGWQINKSVETKDLISQIKSGQSIEKEPKYKQKAFTNGLNDIGNTYVEINLSRQHLWFYRNGSLVVEGDVVTGNIANNTVTPPGVYSLKDKEKDAVLKGKNADGTEYNSPVTYWMPFNEGIGIHDASWRSVFGGSIYLSSGSHGCVNSPSYLASTIFSNIDVGTPVVCYYE
ncbi:L,D-transpeptidase/peptidoglycan binding protein [Clostridium sp. SHJSY1]|uniref:L,D-transpeptidase family protein n=1 Tax=Clostridium sp. SHJSY1 TaxID=2942483 RepID=UPI002875D368|nr:peptidoglycan binding domain-containing protein [Clostridium sp. SHJSY1]MDS0524513.1 L,D-transpeptidase/peptidoglycan binding protein [Clostridium sp. SHJSY1]